MINYSRVNPRDFIARVQHGYELWQYKDSHTIKEWKEHINREKIASTSARDRIRLAKYFLPDRTNLKYLNEIAQLCLPYSIIVQACRDHITDEQRNAFFALVEKNKKKGKPVEYNEIEALFQSVVNPTPKPQQSQFELVIRETPESLKPEPSIAQRLLKMGEELTMLGEMLMGEKQQTA